MFASFGEEISVLSDPMKCGPWVFLLSKSVWIDLFVFQLYNLYLGCYNYNRSSLQYRRGKLGRNYGHPSLIKFINVWSDSISIRKFENISNITYLGVNQITDCSAGKLYRFLICFKEILGRHITVNRVVDLAKHSETDLRTDFFATDTLHMFISVDFWNYCTGC